MAAYQALYRQYRSTTFSDMLGQDTVVVTLRNQVKSGRISHAYLFSGSRGTGKTTAARVLAKAVNCLQPQDGDPCGVCTTCVEMARENCMDILEIDAASNNGVGEIRDLREHVNFPPTIGKYKVYIIDEVHMLSPAAFNALLKTLEEPPPHAVFILATTEQHKLPATVLSRCQRFDFHRIRNVAIVQRLRHIADDLSYSASDEALWRIAQSAEGGMRDALSLLDQCMAFFEQLTLEGVEEVLGAGSQAFVANLTARLLAADVRGLLEGVAQLQAEGRDLTVLLQDVTNRLRNLLFAQIWDETQDATALLEISADQWDELRQSVASQNATSARLLAVMEAVARLESDLKWSEHPRLLLEAALCRIALGSVANEGVGIGGSALAAVEARLDNLEKTVREGAALAPSQTAKPRPQAKTSTVYAPAAVSVEAPPAVAVTAAPPIKKSNIPDWLDVVGFLKDVKMPLSMMLRNASTYCTLEDQAFVVYFPEKDSVYLMAAGKPENLTLIQQAVDALMGQGHAVRVLAEDPKDTERRLQAEKAQRMETAMNIFGADLVEVIDE